jgi:hypothetical protein
MTTITRYRRTVSEAAMREAIIELVTLQGGRVFYIADTRQAPELVDLPDLIVLLPHRRAVAFVELKSQRRATTPGQEAVLELLAECQVCESFIVRPEPKPGEVAYAAFMDWLEGVAS